MIPNKPVDSYDEIKGMLNKVRKIQLLAKPNTYGLIKEQSSNPASLGVGTSPDTAPKAPVPKFQTGNDRSQLGAKSADEYSSDDQSGENEDVTVINNVEVKINSEDPEDLQLSDEEKGKISQLIDDFRTEVSETAEFSKLDIYSDSAKLTGNIIGMNLNFSFSTGDDTGLYISNPSLLKIDNDSLTMITKLKTFETKYANTINDLLMNRSTT